MPQETRDPTKPPRADNRHWSVDVVVREGRWTATICHVPTGDQKVIGEYDRLGGPILIPEAIFRMIAVAIQTVGVDDETPGMYDHPLPRTRRRHPVPKS